MLPSACDLSSNGLPCGAVAYTRYTIRTDEWRYTAWFRFDNSDAGWGPHFGKVFLNESLGTELYDHRGDTGKWLDWPGENYNLVNETEHASLVEELHGRIVDFIQLK
jgi:hypothetical protein